MDAIVEAYRKRRQARLDAKRDDIIQRFRKRRQARLDAKKAQQSEYDPDDNYAKWTDDIFDFDYQKQETKLDDDWITIKGAHALVGESGEIKAGMGDKFTGQKVSEIGKERPRPAPRGHLGIMEEQDAKETIQKELGCTSSEATEYYGAIDRWSRSGYSAVRQYQQGKLSPENRLDYNEVAQRAQAIEDYIENAPQWKGDPIYRGGWKPPEEGAMLMQEIRDKIKSGGTMTMKGTASWSSDKGTSNKFMGDPIDEYSFLYETKGNVKATSIKHMSAMASENEVLMSKTQEFTPTKIRKMNGRRNTWVITMEPVAS